MRRCQSLALGGLIFVVLLGMAGCGNRVVSPAIPQDPDRQQQRYRDMLAWNRRTLADAYDKVGRKDPRWDKPAHEALEAAARFFGRQVDPCTRLEEVYEPAKAAVDAGCNDPLILYLYARSSAKPHDPGQAERERRYTAAALALEQSAYPPFRRAVALCKAALEKAARKAPSAEVRKEAIRMFDAALALLPQSLAEDERNADLEDTWFRVPLWAIYGYRQLMGDYQAAYDRADAWLARIPALKEARLKVRGDFLTHYAWEARGNGVARTVTAEGWKKFRERLGGARRALEEAWALQPDDPLTASMMLTVEKGLGGDRAEMEKWFTRAMTASGGHQPACAAKMDWLDPKWHGSREDLLAFGRACSDTHNWRAGITLLLADAHRRVAQSMSKEAQLNYFRSKEVSEGIRAVYDEYLAHFPDDHAERSQYAAYCYLCGRYVESDEQFRALGENLVYTHEFPEAWMKQVRLFVAGQAKPSVGKNGEERP